MSLARVPMASVAAERLFSATLASARDEEATVPLRALREEPDIVDTHDDLPLLVSDDVDILMSALVSQ